MIMLTYFSFLGASSGYIQPHRRGSSQKDASNFRSNNDKQNRDKSKISGGKSTANVSGRSSSALRKPKEIGKFALKILL